MPCKIITFFNHKGGVGKTTTVHNLSYQLADDGKKVLIIDLDPQMNLTAAVYGLAMNVFYDIDADKKNNRKKEERTWEKERTKWRVSLNKYLNTDEFLQSKIYPADSDEVLELGDITQKELFSRPSEKNSNGKVDLLSGSFALSEMETVIYRYIKDSMAVFSKTIPQKIQSSIRDLGKDYDFVLIDTSPSASSVLNAIIMMLSDYFILPVAPNFFSLQAIHNLNNVFSQWFRLLDQYSVNVTPRGLKYKPKLLGLILQMGKRHKGFSNHTKEWLKDANESVSEFQEYLLQRGCSITNSDFKTLFPGEDPFIIQACCDFTPKLRSIAERKGVPIIHLTEEMCPEIAKNTEKEQSSPKKKEENQYIKSYQSICESFEKISKGLCKLDEL